MADHECNLPYEDCECELEKVDFVPAPEDDDQESW